VLCWQLTGVGHQKVEGKEWNRGAFGIPSEEKKRKIQKKTQTRESAKGYCGGKWKCRSDGERGGNAKKT